MWQRVIDLGKQIIGTSRRQDQCESKIVELTQRLEAVNSNMHNLAEIVRELKDKFERHEDMSANDRQTLLLRLENLLLRHERGLPPGGSLLDEPE